MPELGINELKVLRTVARVLAQPMPLKDQLQTVLDTLRTESAMERGMISILDRETGDALLDVACGIEIDGMEISYKLGEGITGQVAKTGRPMAIANIDDEPLFLDRTGARRDVHNKDLAFLCVPIIYNDQVVGVLSADKIVPDHARLDAELILLQEVSSLIARAVHMRRLEDENAQLKDMLHSSHSPSSELIGNSKIMQEVYAQIFQVADSNTTVLINGETGTGKELAARAIHRRSARKTGPFVEVNCAAMPDTLIESELFGHEKGAFTGAQSRRRGRFEEAHGGTIFLDEIGELSPLAQAKLLRVLQEKRFQLLGSSQMINVNVRIVAATNRDLEDRVQSGDFRSDLYYRLNVFPIYMPRLAERGSDIVLLADYFTEKYAIELNKKVQRISTPAIDLLLAYHWPGNVRELENCIERAVLLSTGDTIESVHLPPSLQIKDGEARLARQTTLQGSVEAYERSLIVDALKDARGNQSEAARMLGTTKRIMQYKVQKYVIDCLSVISAVRRPWCSELCRCICKASRPARSRKLPKICVALISPSHRYPI